MALAQRLSLDQLRSLRLDIFKESGNLPERCRSFRSFWSGGCVCKSWRFWRMRNDFLFSFERIWWMYIDSMIPMGSSIFQTDRGSPKFADTWLWGTHLNCCHLCCCEKVGQPTFEQSWRRPNSSKAGETTATRGLGLVKGWKEWTQGCYSYGAACLPFCYVILPILCMYGILYLSQKSTKGR